MTKVSILCASRSSVYHSLPGVEVYDARRDARTFPGDSPIVAHPPCRSWSAYMGHWAKPEDGERELGLWCCEQLRKCGGVLEQPAHSRLFSAAGLPLRNERLGDLWTIEVWQVWWGYRTRKATWLCFSGVDPDSVQCPLQLHLAGDDKAKYQNISHNQRSETTREFAQWLVGLARQANKQPTETPCSSSC